MNKNRKFTEEQQRRVDAVATFLTYMNTYPNQVGYEDYTDETYIDDILYGLGTSIGPEEYNFHDGYMKFLQRLQEHITKKLEREGPQANDDPYNITLRAESQENYARCLDETS